MSCLMPKSRCKQNCVDTLTLRAVAVNEARSYFSYTTLVEYINQSWRINIQMGLLSSTDNNTSGLIVRPLWSFRNAKRAGGHFIQVAPTISKKIPIDERVALHWLLALHVYTGCTHKVSMSSRCCVCSFFFSFFFFINHLVCRDLRQCCWWYHFLWDARACFSDNFVGRKFCFRCRGWGSTGVFFPFF